MSELSGKKYGLVEKAAVLSLAVLIYFTSLTTPVLGTIAKAFPNESLNTVKLIPTIPSLMVVVTSLIMGPLEKLLSKKKLMYIGMVCSAISILPAFFGDLKFILFTRLFLGVANGIFMPLAGSLIAQLFEGKERASMMGYRIGVGALFGVIFQTYGGAVAMVNWRYSFLGVLMVIPVFFLIKLKLPEIDNLSSRAQNGPKAKLPAKTYIIAVSNFFYSAFVFTFMTNIAIVVNSEKIGTAAQAGFILTVFSAASFVSSMLYGKINQALKKFTMSLAILLLGTSFAIMLNGAVYTTFLVAAAFCGLGFGLGQSDFISKCVGSVPRESATAAMGIMTSFGGIGSFTSPYLLTFLTGLFALKGLRAPWMIASTGFFIGCAIYTAVIIVTKAKSKSQAA